MKDMKIVRLGRQRRLVHVETKLGIVNIYVGLRDTKGRDVESVVLLPDSGVKVVGQRFVRMKGDRDNG